jgi:ubiquinone/menaquinone biosynthesis C-methylase UbiE
VQETGPNRFARQLFDGLPARYDRLAEVLSFGQNSRWRKSHGDRRGRRAWRPGASGSLGRSSLDPGSRVLDVATGPGGVALQLASRTAGTRITGVDVTPQMLHAAQANVARQPYGRPHKTWSWAGPRTCPSLTPPSRLSRLPTCCATWPTPPPRCESWCGW